MKSKKEIDASAIKTFRTLLLSIWINSCSTCMQCHRRFCKLRINLLIDDNFVLLMPLGRPINITMVIITQPITNQIHSANNTKKQRLNNDQFMCFSGRVQLEIEKTTNRTEFFSVRSFFGFH